MVEAEAKVANEVVAAASVAVPEAAVAASVAVVEDSNYLIAVFFPPTI